jgi:hypothetical protein
MRRKYLGDSYDIVKRFLIHSLRSGNWAAHPMLTEDPDIFGTPQKNSYTSLLTIPMLSSEVFLEGTNREAYFDCCRRHCGHLFIDPNTGLRLDNELSVNHLLICDLAFICSPSDRRLILIFDQAISRSRDKREVLLGKIARLRCSQFHAMAYQSHACFLLVSRDQGVIDKARGLLIDTGLQADRLLH